MIILYIVFTRKNVVINSVINIQLISRISSGIIIILLKPTTVNRNKFTNLQNKLQYTCIFPEYLAQQRRMQLSVEKRTKNVPDELHIPR